MEVQESNETTLEIPQGRPKSGRVWKTKQTKRFSSIKREGILKHMATPLLVKEAARVKKMQIRAIEAAMKDNTIQKKLEIKLKREEQQKRRMANEYKSASYQSINTAKLKGMSKKQLRQVKKTVMNKNGQVELVGLYGSASTPGKGRK